ARRLLEHQGLAGGLTLVGGTDRATGRTHKSAVIGSVLHPLGHAPADGAAMIRDRLPPARGAAEHGLPAFLAGWGYGGPAEQDAGFPCIDSVAELTAMLLD